MPGSASGSGGPNPNVMDPYGAGRLVTVVPLDRERQARPTYWNIRQTGANSLRDWCERYYAGEKNGAAYLNTYTIAVGADAEIEAAYRYQGIDGVNARLDESDTLETAMNVLGVHHAVGLTGDTRLGDHLLMVKPPGQTQVLPQGLIEDARSESAALYKQETRSGGGPVNVRQRRAGWFGRPQQQQQQAQGRQQQQGRGRGKGGRGRGGADGAADEV
jgi:hypothetical protein